MIVDLAAKPGGLQPDRVTRFEPAGWHPLRELPSRLPTVMRRQIRGRVETEARDDGVSVTVTRVNRDPFAATALTEVTKL